MVITGSTARPYFKNPKVDDFISKQLSQAGNSGRALYPCWVSLFLGFFPKLPYKEIFCSQHTQGKQESEIFTQLLTENSCFPDIFRDFQCLSSWLQMRNRYGQEASQRLHCFGLCLSLPCCHQHQGIFVNSGRSSRILCTSPDYFQMNHITSH